MKYIRKQAGFIKWIIIGFVVLVLVSYFYDFSVKEAVEDETTQENIEYITSNAESFWDKNLNDAAIYLWNDVFVDLIWGSFIANMERIKDGQPTDFENNAPGVSSTGNITNPPIGKTEV